MNALRTRHQAPLTLLLVSVAIAMFHSPGIASPQDEVTVPKILRNDYVALNVSIRGDRLLSERIEVQPGWASRLKLTQSASIETDADFGLELMYTDWRAPGKQNNADNPVLLRKNDFAITGSDRAELAGGTQELCIFFKAKEAPFTIRITYHLEPGAFFVRKSIAIQDSSLGHHLLRWFWPVRAKLKSVTGVIKLGDYGQPVAVLTHGGGAFFGLEYPASQNHLTTEAVGKYLLSCGQEFGEQVGKTWLQSEWAVLAVTPNEHVKDWFFKYVDAIRVAPLKPYTLYNSWYDLRSAEYPKIPRQNVMSEQSALKMIDLLRKNMIDRHGIHLDAFVLDDGWDVYKSDWVLREEQFPHGLRPLADELKKTNTSLGVWFGPTGGYSFRNLRIAWMRNHGYELVGDQLCVAGKKYSALLTKRVTDFVQTDGVGYYKWDGIQFSCSEPDHGHPIDIYSRRAVLESVIGMCRAVRAKNPAMFLNITSGTWLSPWWVKYANTIWMDGADYGYADVPSISQRDAAITYRDFVLYEDFSLKDLWFPVANLMTHGIIKGKLELLGSPEEPLDKFTDDALLYFARGVSMYELYISPDILSDGEWNTLAKAITWAKDRFPILANTSMIGGNPMKRETYGYAHFKGSRGVVAARNPYITPDSLVVTFAPSLGFDADADSLVVEQVYPARRIAPRFYRSGERFVIPLEGYETAVYEIFPVGEATEPLVAGPSFTASVLSDGRYELVCSGGTGEVRLLNPRLVTSATLDGKAASPTSLAFPSARTSPLVTEFSVRPRSGSTFEVGFTLADFAMDGKMAILLTPDGSAKVPPSVAGTIDGKVVTFKTEQREGRSQWFTAEVSPGKHALVVTIEQEKEAWRGTASLWMIGRQKKTPVVLSFGMQARAAERPMPPHPWNPGEVRENVRVGELHLPARSD